MDKASLVEQVKAIQRQDEDSKQAWWTYCDQNLGSVKDPNRHEASTLRDFINWYHSGGATAPTGCGIIPAGAKGGGKKGTKGGASKGGGKGKDWGGDPWGGVWATPAPAPSWAAGGGGGAWAKGGGPPVGSGGSGANLGDFVKAGQRASVHWKNAWQTYCALYGNGMNDPSRYDDPHITGFIDYVGQLAYADLQAVAAEQGVPLDSSPVGSGGKRPLANPAAYQPTPKRAHYEENSWGAGAGGGQSWNAGRGGDDAQKIMLVQKIKSLQRANPEAKEAWWTYCDESYKGIKDPNRHDEASLEAFLTQYGL